MRYKERILATISLCLLACASHAQLTVSKLFGNGAVLQQNVAIPIWGKARPGDIVSVSVDGVFSDNHVVAVTDASGHWQTEFAAHTGGESASISVKTNTEQLDFTNIVFGDVWLAAGQSNMEWTLSGSDGGSFEALANNDVLQREFKIQKGLSKEPDDELPSASWHSTASANTGNFSAVAYYFAKALRRELNIPIGIVNNAYGGSRIEAWIDEEALGYDEDQAVLQGGIYPERQPTQIYNKMMHPLLKFPFKGIIWYQGESNSDGLEDAGAYGELFRTMINSWRDKMGQGDIPFIWVQLPGVGTPNIEFFPNTWDSWPQTREGQTKALSLPNTGEATAIDLGKEDIHPTNKKPVGDRLALVAKKVAYGIDIPYSGPRFSSYTTNGNTVTIDFNHAEGGLIGDVDNSLKWFSIAGSDGILFKANAVISGNQVKVWNNAVSSPAIVRYAWEIHPAGVNFYNSDNLPAVPFFLHLNKTGFSVTENLQNKTIRSGEKIDFNWAVHGASKVTINGNEVYPTSGVDYYPNTTTTYTFKAINSSNPGDIYTKTVTVTVIDPQPTISISSDQGAAAAPNTLISIAADAKSPGGGTVNQVEFFINGALFFIDRTAPYVMEWTPTSVGNYEITSVVTDSRMNTATSTALTISVSNLDVLFLEAEDATLTGEAVIKNTAEASEGAYVEVRQDWTLGFASFYSTTAGTYSLSIRYQLNFEGPKHQTLFVNGVSQGEVVFSASDNSSWAMTKVDIPIKEGRNTLSLKSSWGWMRFDYMSLSAEPGVFHHNM